MRKIAAHRIILPDGTTLYRQVVVVDSDGSIVSHHPLLCEEPGVEWYPGEIDLRSVALHLGY